MKYFRYFDMKVKNACINKSPLRRAIWETRAIISLVVVDQKGRTTRTTKQQLISDSIIPAPTDDHVSIESELKVYGMWTMVATMILYIRPR